MQAADSPRLCNLLIDLFTIETDFMPNREKQALGFGMLVANTSLTSAVFSAEIDREVIGTVSIRTLVFTAEGGRIGLIEDVIVDWQLRCKNITTLLFDRIIIAWGRRRDLKCLQQLVDYTNLQAINFYVCHGWNATDLRCMRIMLRQSARGLME